MNDILDLDLPEIAPGEGPLPLAEPSYELERDHARFLLRSRGAREDLNQTPNPEPFVLD
ncbi:MAG TPA: hypothetical protein VIS74_03085 [Chthoniobacterales bacterium]